MSRWALLKSASILSFCLVAGTAQGFAAEAMLFNLSATTWKLVLATPAYNDDPVGTLQLTPNFLEKGASKPSDPIKLTAVGNGLTLPPGSVWFIKYLDAPSTWTSNKSSRVHGQTFDLVAADGSKMRLKAYRSVAPDSNVWVGVANGINWMQEDLSSKFVFNLNTPGDILIHPNATTTPAHSTFYHAPMD